jgi:membrane protease subunit (stomatin/prohibitin family)
MNFREFVAGELIDIVEWLDDTGDTMVARFHRPDNELKNGAQLIVRPAQLAVFVDQGKVADVFKPGRHALATSNLPLLSTLRGWKHGFKSPFKAEIVFVNTKQFTGRKWGTSNPVIVRDPELGMVRLRAFGTYAIRVDDATKLVKELVGTNSTFLVDQIEEQLRNLAVTFVSEALAESNIPVIDLARSYPELGDRVMGRVAPKFQQYGLGLTQLVIENVSLPPEVEKAVDQRSKMSVVGDLDQYAKLQSADALREAAQNPSGGAAAGVGIGMGAAMAHKAMSPQAAPHAAPPPVPSPDEPPAVPQEMWYYVVAGERRGPLDLAGLKQQMAAGAVLSDTLVWKKGMGEWTAVAQLPSLKALLK